MSQCPTCRHHNADHLRTCELCGASLQPQVSLEDVLQQIQELLRQNNKIEAIKIYRDATGAGLKDSKEAVEAIELGKLPNISNAPLASQSEGGEWQAEAMRLMKAGQKIEAIKICRERTGMGLKEAKEWVERLERSPPPPSSSGGSIDALALWWVVALAVMGQAAAF